MVDVLIWGTVCFVFIAFISVDWSCYLGSHRYVYDGKVVHVGKRSTAIRSKYRCSVCGKDKPIKGEDFKYNYDRM